MVCPAAVGVCGPDHHASTSPETRRTYAAAMAHRHFGIEVRQGEECPVCLDLGATSRHDAKKQAGLVTDVIVEVRDNDEPTTPISSNRMTASR